MERLICPVQGYAWGSVSAIPELLGTEPTGEPQAELWMGTHERGPAVIERDGSRLGDVIADDPAGQVGERVVRTHRSRLPYLMKILAADEPLSIQAHPNKAQAEAGFAREEAAGIAIDAPNRSYRDDNHKPELICAVTPFTALCGFRDPDSTADLFGSLDVDLLYPVIEALRPDDESGTASDRIRAALTYLLMLSSTDASSLTARVAVACARPSDEFVEERRWAVRCAARYPDGAGVVTGLMLNLLQLRPGQALYLGAGNLHAYLEGTGIEIMAQSDNVLRGGMTSKHVDVEQLLAVVDCRPGAPEVQEPTTAHHVFEGEVSDFSLARIAADTTAQRSLHSAEIVLSIGGETLLQTDDDELLLRRGEVGWIPAHHGRYQVATTPLATAFVGAVGVEQGEALP